MTKYIPHFVILGVAVLISVGISAGALTPLGNLPVEFYAAGFVTFGSLTPIATVVTMIASTQPRKVMGYVTAFLLSGTIISVTYLLAKGWPSNAYFSLL